MTDKIIWRLPKVIGHTGLKRSTIYTKMEDGTFPHSIKLGSRSVGWDSDDVNEWIQFRIDASRSGDSS